MNGRDDEVLFREQQRFGRAWVWLVVLGGGGPPVVIFGIGLWGQLVRKMTFGNQPMSDTALIVLFFVSLAAVGFVAWMMAAARLETEVRRGILLLRYRPFHHMAVPTARIARAEVRRYAPIREFGGWGLRYGFGSGWAWNVSGDMGVQLWLENGRKLLIGSRRAAELKEALDRAAR